MLPVAATMATLTAGRKPADPADPEMIGEGQGRVADPAREHLDQRRRLRTVERRRGDHEQQKHGDQDGQVHPRRVGALGIAGRLQRRADRVAAIGLESLELRPRQDLRHRRPGRRCGRPQRGSGGRLTGACCRRCPADQRALGDVAGAGELAVPTGIELGRAGGGIGFDHDRRAALSGDQRRVGGFGDPVRRRENRAAVPAPCRRRSIGLRPIRSDHQPKKT